NYALGCTLFQMLTGLVPYPGSSFREKADAHQHRPPPDPRATDPSLPEGLAQFVGRMMAKDPADRPQTAREVALALAPFAGMEMDPVPLPVATADWQPAASVQTADWQAEATPGPVRLPPESSTVPPGSAAGRSPRLGWVIALVALVVALPLLLVGI